MGKEWGWRPAVRKKREEVPFELISWAQSRGTSDRPLVACQAPTLIHLLTCLIRHSLVMKAVAHSVSAQTWRMEGPQHNSGDSRIAAPVSRSLPGDKLSICIGLRGHGNAIPGNCGCDKMSHGVPFWNLSKCGQRRVTSFFTSGKWVQVDWLSWEVNDLATLLGSVRHSDCFHWNTLQRYDHSQLMEKGTET